MSSNTTYNTTTFATNIVQYLQPSVAPLCRAIFPSISNSLNASNPTALAATLNNNPSKYFY